MDLRALIASGIEELDIPTPEFAIKVGWAPSYEDLFAGHLVSESDVFDLVKIATEKGFVLLTGKGGGAKTVIVFRLAKRALKSHLLPIVITLEDWTGKDYESWKAADSQPAKVDFLLDRFGITATTSLKLEAIPPQVIRLMLLDGLNEVSSRVGQEIIYA